MSTYSCAATCTPKGKAPIKLKFALPIRADEDDANTVGVAPDAIEVNHVQMSR